MGGLGLSRWPPSAPLELDLLPLCVTFLLCLWEVQYGILAGTLLSLLILLHAAARPRTQVPGPPRGAWAWALQKPPATATLAHGWGRPNGGGLGLGIQPAPRPQ